MARKVIRAAPPILYKYRSCSEASLVNTAKIFTHRQVWFAEPSTLNDPFDCDPPVSLPHSDPQLRAELAEMYLRHNAGASREECLAYAREQASNRPRLLEQLRMAMRQTVAETGVLSLSSAPENSLMWTHYADEHRGICVGFRTDRRSIFHLAYRIRYSDRRRQLRFGDPPGAIVDKVLLTKARDWEYEREWRVFTNRGMKGAATFDVDDLAVVVIGARASDTTVQAVHEWTKGTSTRILYASFDLQQYRIRIESTRRKSAP